MQKKNSFEFIENEISFHSSELKKELQSLKNILQKTNEDPLLSTIKHYTKIDNSRINKHLAYLSSFYITCHKDVDIFPILHKKSRAHEIFLEIPETLIYSSHGKPPAFLFNNAQGFISADSTESSLDHFFYRIEKSYAKDPRPGLPLLIHKSKGIKSRIYFDIETARKDFEECPYRFHIMQRFIRVKSSAAWKVVVDWQEGNSKYFSLTNNIQYDEPSNLPRQYTAEEKFLVNFKQPKSYHVVASLKPISELNKIIKQLIPTLSTLIFQEKKPREVVVEFIKDIKNAWVFVAIKGYTFKGEHTNRIKKKKKVSISKKLEKYPVISLSFAKSPQSSDETRPQHYKIIEDKKINKASNKMRRQATSSLLLPRLEKHKIDLPNADEQYSMYLKQKNSDSQGRIPFNMIGVIPHKIGSHFTAYIERNKDLLPKFFVSKDPPIGKYLSNSISVKSSEAYVNMVTQLLDTKLTKAAELKARKKSIEEISETDSYNI